MEKWPKYKDKLVIVGQPESNIGVVTCWTDREVASRQLPMDQIAAVGNLYSPNRGLDYLVANVLAHPYMNMLIVAGSDKLGSGDALLNLIKYGFDEGVDDTGRPCWRIRRSAKGRISMDITKVDLNHFRDSVNVYDLRNSDFQEVRYHVKKTSNLYEQIREPRAVSLTEITVSNAFPNRPSGHRIVGRTVAEAFIKILEYILKFGVVSNTQYQTLQQESLTLLSVITDEDPDNLLIPSWFPFEANDFRDKYLHTVLDVAPVPEGVAYWYSDRMRVRWGDQIQRVIDKLKQQRETRQLVVSLWDPVSDLQTKEPPCLNHLWFRVQAGKLFLDATIRSNDMFRAYPSNALSMRVLQDMVRKAVDPDMGLGELVIISQSAHIYDESLDAARRVIENHKNEVVQDDRMVVDPAGIFEITLEDNMIKVKHLTPEGSYLQEFTGRTAMQVYLKLGDHITIMEHALYLGTELQKAEHAAKLGLGYVQDKPLALPALLQ